MKKYFIVLFLIFSLQVSAEERLTSRFLYFANDPQCMIWPSFAWEKKQIANNRAVLRYTIENNFFYRYTPKFNGLVGNAEVFIYKYCVNAMLDKKVLVEVAHAGKIDTLHVDFNTTRDQWISLGRFAFTGEQGKEYVQITRQSETNSGSITPILPIRYDLYYDTNTKPLTNAPKLPVGLSTNGNWKAYKKSGYREQLSAFLSTDKGDVATWNPGLALAGKLNIYLYRPNIKANDVYRLAHNGKMDELRLKNLTFANLDLFNPVTSQGWYKLGEYDFSGNGNEYLQLEKLTNDSSMVDCMMLEKVNLDGTLLDRIVVTPKQFDRSIKPTASKISLEEKIKTTQQIVGLSPNNNGHSIATSAKNGSTIYSRALYSKEKSHRFIWNPCIVEAGEYDLYYFPYFLPTSNGRFEVFSNGGKTVTEVKLSDMVAQKQLYVGKYNFAADKRDEYVVMSDINRASDVTFEKKLADGAVLKQVVVTAHPYFVEYEYADTKNLSECHELGEMVRRGFAKPLNENTFGINKPVSTNDYVQILQLMLDSMRVKYTQTALLYKVNSTPKSQITLDNAAQLMLNAMECSGRYANVRNYFKTSPQTILQKYTDNKAVVNAEAVARMIETGVIKLPTKNLIEPTKNLNRKEAVLLLKDFFEQILCSGPPARADWEVTFFDEFEGTQIDWTKWYADDAVRFKNVSAKWKENCVVENGLFKGYNFMDNHEVPYSSGNLHSVYRQTYGFFESRYKYPDKAYGSHSSFWANSRGGDFNYNEGAYPNSVSNNNYFLRGGENFHDFAMPTNMAHDFHTVSGYLNDKNLFYGMDGRISWEINDYPRLYSEAKDVYSPFGKTTNSPYNAMISTVVTYFDGPLDRDRIDGSYMACDWVRMYKETSWKPKVESLTQISPTEWELKFNKPMDAETINNSTVLVFDSNEKPINLSVRVINNMRYVLKFNQGFTSKNNYKLKITGLAKDIFGESLFEKNEGYFYLK
jgi:hypothetical protein